MQRRSLIKAGFAATALLAVAGGGLAVWRPGWADGRLTAAGREVFAAVSRAVLGPLLPPDAAALDAQLARLDTTIAGFPAATQREVAELLALLATAPARLALTGLATDWPAASAPQLQAMLERLRHSPLALRRQVYHALRDLTNAAYFADAAAWQAIGYPGPRSVPTA